MGLFHRTKRKACAHRGLGSSSFGAIRPGNLTKQANPNKRLLVSRRKEVVDRLLGFCHSVFLHRGAQRRARQDRKIGACGVNFRTPMRPLPHQHDLVSAVRTGCDHFRLIASTETGPGRSVLHVRPGPADFPQREVRQCNSSPGRLRVFALNQFWRSWGPRKCR